MRIIKPNRSGITEAVAVLRRGGVIVYPTDTAYGLGGIFDSPAVTKKILKIKNRQDKKFTVVASSVSQVEKFFQLNALEKKLARQYWPGPLSLVVSKRFAVRVPKNKVTQTLCRQAGKPLIATSANLSGQATLYNPRIILNQFKNKKNQPALLIDAGILKKIKTSTIVDASRGTVVVLRPGAVAVL